MPSRKRALTITITVIMLSMLIPIFLLFYTQVGGGAVLHVSLLEGTLAGEDPDPWLNECWLLNLTGTSQTFTVRINNTSAAKESYDTHLIIALNDAGYSYLENLNVDDNDIQKSAFQYGTPKPYNIWIWPSGDVYPTWFNDTCVKIGTIPPKGYKEVTVSVTFSNATGVRMHFDAYGSSVDTIPTKTGDITRNPLSGDSTVLFQPEAPTPHPPFAEFLYYPSWPNTNETVTFNASASYDSDGYIASYNWDFGDGTPVVIESDPVTTHSYNAFGNYTVTLTIIDNDGLTANSTNIISVRQHPVASFIFSPPDPSEGEQIIFDASTSTPDGGTIISYEWDFGDDNITTTSDPIITNAYSRFGNYNVTLNVTDSEGKWDTESKTITVRAPPPPQYYLTVRTEPTRITTIPGEDWYDNCTHVELTAPLYVPDETGFNGERYVFTQWTVDDNFIAGNPITVHMDANHTAIAHYVKQYLVTFTQTGLDGTAIGAVVTVNDMQLNYTQLPFAIWVNESSWINYTYNDIVPSTVSGKRFKLVGITGPPSPFLMTEPITVVGSYKTQYQITVTAIPDEALGGTFKVTYTQCGTTYTDVQQTTPWTEWIDANTTVTVSKPQDVITVSSDMRYKFDYYTPSDSVIMDQAKTITLIYKIQYYLTVKVDPPNITIISGEGWYDNCTNVELTAPTVKDYEFEHWDVDGLLQGDGAANITVHMNAPHTATAHYAGIPPISVSISPTTARIKVGESVTFTSDVSGGKAPYSYQWYLNGSAVLGATDPTWTFTPETTGFYTVYMVVTDSFGVTAQSNEASVTVAPKLLVSISPTSAEIFVEESVEFTSAVSGGYTPYSYQWFLNDKAVSGATSSSWTFTPTAGGIYYVYLKVTDDNGNVVQSETARVAVSAVPVGGYSVAIKGHTIAKPLTFYLALVVILAGVFVAIRRKMLREN
ncbi:PKD domain-containing protein [Candidatus Bathyarchaeota archaeon]|nr:PKD domain-containing protein [Candidatus Bathyarchaeota archaeon]